MDTVKLAKLPEAQRAREARRHFLDGKAVPRGLLPSGVLRSWERSHQLGVTPDQAPLYGEKQAIGRAQAAADRRLLRSVSREIDHLWSAFGGLDWTIFCVDTNGTVLHAQHSAFSRHPLFTPIERGRNVHEAGVGTTAPTCTLHEGAPAVVTHAQHYLDAFAQVVCLAVPLVGVHGEPLGALDITGIGRCDARRLHEHFHLAGLAIEQSLYAGLRHCHLLSVHADPRWLDTPLAGTLAVDEDGYLVAASRRAREALGWPPSGALVRRPLHDTLVIENAAQRRRLLQAARRPHRVACMNGTHVWMRYLRKPLAGERIFEVTQPTTSPGVDASLQTQMLQGIHAALEANDGNVAATARQLGISRTTLYARLRQGSEPRPDTRGT